MALKGSKDYFLRIMWTYVLASMKLMIMLTNFLSGLIKITLMIVEVDSNNFTTLWW